MKNETLFEKIDSEISAYWLGFILADGNLHKNGHALQINLSRIDKHHLNKLGKLLGQKVMNAEWTRNDKISKGCYLCFSCAKNWQFLYRLGVLPNKTHTDQSCVFKNVPDHLRHHFLRGLFDGDGCISRVESHGKVLWSASWCGESNLMNEVCLYLHDKLGVSLVKNENRHLVTIIRWGGKRQTKTIANYLYTNATIYLKRKHDKFKQLHNEPCKGKYFGVTHTRSGKWNASIIHDGQRTHLGNFETPEDAALAHDKMAKLIGKPLYKLNFKE